MMECHNFEECEYNGQPECRLPDGMKCPHGVKADKPTNADRIRAMSDEELAKFLCNFRSCDSSLEPEKIREFAEDVIRQFAYKVKADGRCAYSTGGLSTLEWAFSILGWPDPKPAPECECQEEGCHEWAVGGRPTPDGYKWLCSRHFEEAEA